MKIGVIVRSILILSPAILLIASVAWFVASQPTKTVADQNVKPLATGAGKLVVVAVFDQLRGDYPERFGSEFGPNGFKRMQSEGVSFPKAMIPYACTSTGPGHASISTGAPPSVHGIIENRWYDRATGKTVYSVTPDEFYSRVPAGSGESRKWPGFGPARLIAPTVADTLSVASLGKARTYSLSLKDRAAVLMGGKEPTGVYCFDSSRGEFHTSSFYRESVPVWVDAFNQSHIADRWSGQTWSRLKSADVYDTLAGPDDAPGEGNPTSPRKIFPHTLPDANQNSSSYYSALEASPFGNDLLWEFAKSVIDAEELGNSGRTDLLNLSFSSNDILGHAYGPNSHEVMDATLRSDMLIGTMIDELDKRLTRGRYTLIVVSDHGIAPLPESKNESYPDAKRIAMGDLVAGLDSALDSVFGMPDGVAGRWVDGNSRDTHPWVYLNRRTIEASGRPHAIVEEYARSWLAGRPNTLVAFSRSQLEAEFFRDDLSQTFGPMVKQSYHPDRAGDLYVVLQPGVLVSGALSTGTDHGTPHDYDRHIVFTAIGSGIPPAGKQTEAVSSLSIAAVTSYALGISSPAKAIGKLPAIFSKK